MAALHEARVFGRAVMMTRGGACRGHIVQVERNFAMGLIKTTVFDVCCRVLVGGVLGLRLQIVVETHLLGGPRILGSLLSEGERR